MSQKIEKSLSRTLKNCLLNQYFDEVMPGKAFIFLFSLFLTDLFVGQLKSMLKCCDCEHTSITFDPFWDLSLPIPRVSQFL